MSVSAIGNSVGQAIAVGDAAAPAGTGDVPFSRVLSDLVTTAEAQQAGIGHELERIVTGEADGVQDLVTTVAQADLAFRLMVEIRDRLIASYHEIMRMQV